MDKKRANQSHDQREAKRLQVGKENHVSASATAAVTTGAKA